VKPTHISGIKRGNYQKDKIKELATNSKKMNIGRL
jgi:hypothetical protein